MRKITVQRIVFALQLFLFFSLFKPGFAANSPSQDYFISAEDVLDINVLKDDTLTRILTVDSDGSITLPYINKVKVAGLSCKEAASLIAERLKSGNFLIDPKVTVSVKEYRGQKIMVFGLVKTPGIHYLNEKTYALDLLKQVEISPEVNNGKMVITRKDPAGDKIIEVDLPALVLRGDLAQNIEVLPGDSIVISAKDHLPEQSSDNDYIIAEEDVLDINVWKDENLTKVLSVDSDGSITLPYINKVKVAGLSCKEAASLIAERLKSGN
ncbi:MAG: polysaccharide biosynthesis/export family protein, partial [Candidatus Omnitrophica bacterium]|nr:polysaccharide biosynthesis/export family protein [Candidatus Omnitrophota bacterium]